MKRAFPSGSVPGYLGNKVKEALRDAVNDNFQAPHYDCFGDASGASKPNLLGDTGDLPGTGTSNVDAFTTAQSRQAWLISRGVSHPPLQIISFPEALSVQSGDEATFSVTVTGGDGSTVGYDWRHSGVHVGALSTLSWDYALPSDTGEYVVYVCDDTWQRSSLPVELVVSLRTFSITTQPQAAEVPQSDAHAFSVVVTGGGSMPTYQWYYGATEEALSPITGCDGGGADVRGIGDVGHGLVSGSCQWDRGRGDSSSLRERCGGLDRTGWSAVDYLERR